MEIAKLVERFWMVVNTPKESTRWWSSPVLCTTVKRETSRPTARGVRAERKLLDHPSRRLCMKAICVAPREVAEQLVDAYRLKLLDLDEDWALRHLVICFRDEKALTPAAKLLLEHLNSARIWH